MICALAVQQPAPPLPPPLPERSALARSLCGLAPTRPSFAADDSIADGIPARPVLPPAQSAPMPNMPGFRQNKATASATGQSLRLVHGHMIVNSRPQTTGGMSGTMTMSSAALRATSPTRGVDASGYYDLGGRYSIRSQSKDRTSKVRSCPRSCLSLALVSPRRHCSPSPPSGVSLGPPRPAPPRPARPSHLRCDVVSSVPSSTS